MIQSNYPTGCKLSHGHGISLVSILITLCKSGDIKGIVIAIYSAVVCFIIQVHKYIQVYTYINNTSDVFK